MGEKADVQALLNCMAAALKAKDAAAYAKHYDDNAKLYPSRGKPIVGRANIEEFFKGKMSKDDPAGEVKYEVQDLDNCGSVLVGAGAFTTSHGTHSHEGKFICLFQKCGDTYKILYNMWNSSG